MLVCLACPKQTHLHDDHHHATLAKSGAALNGPSKEHIKSFTTQLKDIVMKFSSGAYRHCRPCTAAAVRGGVVDDDRNQILYEYDDEKSSILVGSNSEEQAMSDHMHHNGMLNDDESGASHQLGDSSSSCRYDLLPMARRKRHKKKAILTSSTSSSRSAPTLKQLPSNPDPCDAIEELLNAHFLREERILAEERACASRDDEQLLSVESRADHQLLEEAQLVSREHHVEDNDDDDDDEDNDGDVHVSIRGKRHAKLETSGGKFEEWVAQVEPGVMITFVALHDGSNHLKRIRFSREMFSKWQAQEWWAENSEMVRELYSVSRSEAPFKSCSSARSSSATSSTSTSSLPQHALRNTPELQSRAGSCQASPSKAYLVVHTMENKTYSPTQPSNSCKSNLSCSHSLGSISHEMVERHDNPLYDTPEFELCYHEGVKDSFIIQRDLWVEGNPQDFQHVKDGVMDGDDPNSLASGLVREVKRVRFIRQVPQISS